MSLRPANVGELQQALAGAHAARRRVGVIDLTGMARLLEHHPEDLTCTIECGCTLAALQEALGARGQWLPLDPPHAARRTIRDVIDANLSGPRRQAFGTVRDYLIGLEVVQADGTRIRSGGRVVKNVAGYDLHKLFVGSHGILGVPVVATFKLLPRPEATAVRRASCSTPVEAVQRIATVARQLPGLIAADVGRFHPRGSECDVYVEISGSRREVDQQIDAAHRLGFVEPDTERWDEKLWDDPNLARERFSVLPSNLAAALDRLSDRRFIARTASGVVYHEGEPLGARSFGPRFLLERLKASFDPFGVLPSLLELKEA
jgi:FAD/FMN-containing dehydrogenase